jgi:hypothetical protein
VELKPKNKSKQNKNMDMNVKGDLFCGGSTKGGRQRG